MPRRAHTPKQIIHKLRRGRCAGREDSMTRWSLLLVGVVGMALLSQAAVIAETSAQPPVIRHAGKKLMSGQWTYDFGRGLSLLVLVDEGPITGFGFSLSGGEIAYCLTAGETGGSSLRLVSLPAPEEFGRSLTWATDTARRLLWIAPEGVELGGPVWWAFDGSQLALRAGTGAACDLVALDYMNGEATWLTRGANVIDAAWSPRADRIAYVTQEEGERELWVNTFPPTTPRRLGEGGLHLRWSLTPGEAALTWFSPRADRWDRLEWTPGAGEAAEVGTAPARPEGALQSPDGAMWAVLEPVGDSGEQQLVFYQRNSTAGEELPLPDVNPEQLLCWSPDSHLVLVRGAEGVVLAVGARPVSSAVLGTDEEAGYGVPRRVRLAAVSSHAGAGPPSWSAAGNRLAYVLADEGDSRPIGMSTGEKFPFGNLVVTGVVRDYAKTPDDWEEEVVLKNMSRIATAMQMYLAYHDDTFPGATDAEELRKALDRYLQGGPLFARPGHEDYLVVDYVGPPGVSMASVQDPARMPIAVADYAPGFFAVAYADGNVESFERTPENVETLEAWWEELGLLREQDAAAHPPPFPPIEAY